MNSIRPTLTVMFHIENIIRTFTTNNIRFFSFTPLNINLYKVNSNLSIKKRNKTFFPIRHCRIFIKDLSIHHEKTRIKIYLFFLMNIIYAFLRVIQFHYCCAAVRLFNFTVNVIYITTLNGFFMWCRNKNRNENLIKKPASLDRKDRNQLETELPSFFLFYFCKKINNNLIFANLIR